MNEKKTDKTVDWICGENCVGCRTHTEEEIIRFSEKMGQKVIRQGGNIAFERSGDTLYVHWRITNQCNYRCSYCFLAGTDHRKRGIMPSLEQVKMAIKNLAAANRAHYRVILVGGEPMMYPFISETILLLWAGLGEKLEYVSIITNGSFSDGQMETLIDIGRFVDIHINVSVHAEFAAMERLSKLVKKLSSSIRLHFKVMLHPLYMDRIKSMVEELISLREEHAFSFEIGLLRRPPDFVFDDARYTQAHYDYFVEAPKRFMQAALNGARPSAILKRNDGEKGWRLYLERNVGGRLEHRDNVSFSELRTLTDSYDLKGMICCAGVNMLDIFANGACRGLACGGRNAEANIYKEDPFLVRNLIKVVKCEKARCGNSANYNTPKFLLSNEAEIFIETKRRRQTELTEEWLRRNGKNG